MAGRVTGVIGGALATVFVLAQFVFWVGSATGFVWQICLEPEGAPPAQARVEQGVVYVLFPPLLLSSIDPPGSCVRNTPLHQGLSALGVWELPPPRVQVEDHLRSQELGSGSSIEQVRVQLTPGRKAGPGSS